MIYLINIFIFVIGLALFDFHQCEAFQSSIIYRLPIVPGDTQRLSQQYCLASVITENTDILPLKDDSDENISKIGAFGLENKAIKSNKMNFWLSISGIFMAFFVLLITLGPGAWRYFLAGGLCSAISHGITTPVDVIKTRKQVDQSLKDLGLIKSGLKIVTNDGGVKALVAGLGPTTYGYLFEGAVKFGVYEILKPSIMSILTWSASITSMPFLNSNTLGLIISGCLAGTAASVVLCPMEALRIRLVAEPEFAVGGWVDGGLSMIENEGVRGLWKGFSAMMSKQVPYTVTKNVSFDILTRIAYSMLRKCGYIITRKMKIIIPFISAIVVSVLSCISSQPGDLLLSLVNAKEGNARTRDFARDIIKEHGVKGFFVEMNTRFLHVGMIVTVQLTIYDFVKRLCGITATGL